MKCAGSALFSDNDRKYDQFIGRGTSQPSTSRRVDFAISIRCTLVVLMIDSFLYEYNIDSLIFWTKFQLCFYIDININICSI